MAPLKPELLVNTDVLVVREQCLGLYFGEPRGIVRENGLRRGFNTESYREDEIARVARKAFELARGRRKNSLRSTNIMFWKVPGYGARW